MIRPSGPCPARIMIVGDFPGDEEMRRGEPFCGRSGDELNRMLKDAGIMRSECFVTSVLRTRPPGGEIEPTIALKKKDITGQHVQFNGKWVLPVVQHGAELLAREIEMCQPNIIIALGNVALWALSGHWSAAAWRGSLIQTNLKLALDYQPKVMVSYAPAMVLRQWSWRPTVVHDLRRAKKEAAFRDIFRRDYKFVIRPDYSTTVAYLDLLTRAVEKGPTKFALDIETRAGHTACLGIAWSPTEAICIPFMCTERDTGYWTLEEESVIVHKLMHLLQHPNMDGVGQNFNYDAQYFWRHWHFVPRIVRDTMIQQHAMFANQPKSLDHLASLYAQHYEYWKADGKEWDPSIDEEVYWAYNCKDACYTFEVDDGQQATIKALTPSWPKLPQVADFQQSMFYPVLKSMDRGVRIDHKKRAGYAAKLFMEIQKREVLIHQAVGYPLNVGSPQQMQDFFYTQMGLKPIISRKTRTVTCDDEALTTIAEREPILAPLIKLIKEMRSMGVFLGTFVQAPLDKDGRMRCSYNIAGTETYRFASRKNAFGTGMNMQNIPKGDEGLDLPNIRELFLPDENMEFFDIDLSSADLRIVVWEADEPEMKEMLAKGLDPYTEICKEYYRDQSIKKSDPRRQIFKALAHGTHYLGTPAGMAPRVGLLVADVERVQKWYLGKNKKIAAWQRDFKDQVLKRRFVENVFGNRCYVFDRIEGTIFNQMIAWIPQSTVGLIINRAYAAIDATLPAVQVLMQVHDSLAGQFPRGMSSVYVPKIVKAAEIELPYADPLVIPVGVKTSTESWGMCG